MTTSLGEKAIADTLLATQIGEDKARVDTIYVNNIVPPPTAAPETLQATMTAGNETTINMKIANDIDMYNTADTGFATKIVGLTTDPTFPNGGNFVIQTKAADPAVLQEHTLFRAADLAIEMKGSVIIDAVGDEVQIGRNGDNQPLGNESVNVGENAGTNGHAGVRAVNVGWGAGRTNCGSRSVAIGDEAGEVNSGAGAVSIGSGAGENGTGDGAIAIGRNAGTTAMATDAIVIGDGAAPTAGLDAIAIGASAGATTMNDNSIVINATGSTRNSAGVSTCVIDPVRGVERAQNDEELLHINSTSKEVYFDRIRYNFRLINTNAGGFVNLTDTDPSVIIVNWTSGSGIYGVFLPSTSTIPFGTYFIIKNLSTTPGQDVAINPFSGQTIDNSTAAASLSSTARSTTGGGGSCLEVMYQRGTNWIIVRGYNQSFN
jgi:hypothetical protein